MNAICNNCKLSGIINFETGEAICPKCGRVLIERSPDQTSSSQLHSSSLLTIPDARIQRVVEKLNLPQNVSDEALNLLNRTKEAKIFRKRSRALDSAIVYAACKSIGISRPIQEIVSASPAPSKEVLRIYRRLAVNLEKKTTSSDSLRNLSRLCNDIGVAEVTKRRSIEMFAKLSKRLSLKSRNPLSLTCAIVYLACVIEAENLTLQYIARRCGASKDAVMEVLKELRSDPILESLAETAR